MAEILTGGMEEYESELEDCDLLAASREVADYDRFAASRDPEDAMSEAAECIREWREVNDPDYADELSIETEAIEELEP